MQMLKNPFFIDLPTITFEKEVRYSSVDDLQNCSWKKQQPIFLLLVKIATIFFSWQINEFIPISFRGMKNKLCTDAEFQVRKKVEMGIYIFSLLS